MTTLRRSTIERTIIGLEAGRFQELMLAFLPRFNARFSGLTRFGGTIDGKTRGGVPDLLLTTQTGDQLGCECGTEQQYWTPPADQEAFADWKPISDGRKCLQAIDRPIEIVLAASQPLSSKHPNAKALVLDYLRKLSPCFITLFSSEDLAAWIDQRAEEASLLPMLQEFFPETAEVIQLQHRDSVFQTAMKQGEQLGIPIRRLVDVVERIGPGAVTQQHAISALFADPSRYTLAVGSDFAGVPRCRNQCPAMLEPFGKILQLLGAPKIGKTFLCREVLSKVDSTFTWMQMPFDSRQTDDFVDAATVAILSHFWPSELVASHVYRKDLESLLALPVSPTTNRHLVILDNAHQIHAAALSRLKRTLEIAKDQSDWSTIGILVVSNRHLENQLPVITQTLVAPAWTAQDLGLLLSERNVQLQDSKPDQYASFLAVKSCGHPLWALKLARQYPSRQALAATMTTPLSDLSADLPKDIKAALYDDILAGADQQNFVQRLSLLIFKAQEDVVDALRLAVNPTIQTSSRVLIETIGPAVIDGTPQDGVVVSSPFKEVAKSRVSRSEANEVYQVAADVLLKPDGRVIDAGKAMDAIVYLVLSHQLARAAGWGLILLDGIKDETKDRDAQVKYVLGRLSLLHHLKTDGLDTLDVLAVEAFRVMSAQCSRTIGREDDAANTLSLVDVRRLGDLTCSSEDQNAVRIDLRAYTIITRLLGLRRSKSPQDTLDEFFALLRSGEASEQAANVVRLVPELVARLPPATLVAFNWRPLVSHLFSASPAAAFELAVRLAAKLHHEPKIASEIESWIDDADTAHFLFAVGFHGAALFDGDKRADHALDVFRWVTRSSSANDRDLDSALVCQYRGDILFDLRAYRDASSEYRASSGLCDPTDKPLLAWNSYRLGLTTDSSAERIECLRAATLNYLALEDWRQASLAKAALAAHWLQTSEFNLAIDVALELAQWVHNEHRTDVIPALRLLAANLAHITRTKDGATVPPELPPPDPIAFSRLPRSMDLKSTGTVTYEIIGLFAESVGLSSRAVDCYRMALSAEITTDEDRQMIVVAWYHLFQAIDFATVTATLVAELLATIVKCQPLPGTREETLFLVAACKPFLDVAARGGSPAKHALDVLLEAAAVTLSNFSDTVSSRWQPSLADMEARRSQLLGNERRAYNQFRSAAQGAIRMRQFGIGEAPAFEAAFRLSVMHGSLREAAASQFELFICIINGTNAPASVEALGINLFRMWRSIQWRRLSEYDLTVKSLLFDVARDLASAGFDDASAAPVMLAGLVQAFSNDSPKVEPFLCSRPVPESVMEKLGSHLRVQG